MTSIERTAYPRFKRLITAHELHLFFAPPREEAAWAAERMDSDGHQLALLLALKAHISPYLTEHIERFGEYSTHELGIRPEAYETKLDVDFKALRDANPPAEGFSQAA
ncbi:hypothetical protein P3T37_000817 [Kitasatospora sp. MAA4]|uniref:hypothetical protein n=1 Tax=Kitasatospora sp. MAA4 TaxID=3035093 RepID=UPI0024765389|nr:hypothetical protein [Kitasatospora sp. MAA4]MDH6131448.1 hypothetical protein [Kitasatospora sp. MAA4]